MQALDDIPSGSTARALAGTERPGLPGGEGLPNSVPFARARSGTGVPDVARTSPPHPRAQTPAGRLQPGTGDTTNNRRRGRRRSRGLDRHRSHSSAVRPSSASGREVEAHLVRGDAAPPRLDHPNRSRRGRIDEPAFDPAIGIRPSHLDGIAIVPQARGLKIEKTRKRITSQDFVVYPTYGTGLVMSA